MLSDTAHEVMTMQSADIKRKAHAIIDQLPIDATWDDVLYHLVERREIEMGLADSEAGRTTPVDDVMREFDIDP